VLDTGHTVVVVVDCETIFLTWQEIFLARVVQSGAKLVEVLLRVHSTELVADLLGEHGLPTLLHAHAVLRESFFHPDPVFGQ